jgi:hypothetical protein
MIPGLDTLGEDTLHKALVKRREALSGQGVTEMQDVADSDETFHPFQRKVATCSKAKLPVIGAKRRWSFVLRQVVCQVKL